MSYSDIFNWTAGDWTDQELLAICEMPRDVRDFPAEAMEVE